MPRDDSGSARFASTHWSLVLAAGHRSAPESDRALAELCQGYWYPLYAFVRRRVADVHSAQDLTQDFFTRLLEKNWLAAADPQRGRFRSFLLTSLQHFLANEADRARAQKRGGRKAVLSLDWRAGEERFLREPAHSWSAERLFERHWALTLLERVLNRLRDEMTAGGRDQQFEVLKSTLQGERSASGYAELAEKLGMTPAAARVAAHRLRKRYRDILQVEVRQTLANPEEADDELRRLFQCLAR